MITIFVEITAQSGKEDLFYESLKAMIEPSRAEEGCLEYRITQSESNPAIFLTFERFASMDDFESHKSSDHYQKFVALVGEFLAKEPKIAFVKEM